jgi:hypothetical protein
VRKRKNSDLQIYAGVHDGFSGPIPISHSINFYNKIVKDFHENATSHYVSAEDAAVLLKTQSFPAQKTPESLGDRAILYQKESKRIRLTVFEGAHEILYDQVLPRLVEWPKK